MLRQHGLGNGPGVGSTGARLITVPGGRELQLIDALDRNPAVEYAEPDLIVTAAAVDPNDPFFPSQYALKNTSQPFTNNNPDSPITVDGGLADADVDAVEAWDTATGIDSTGKRIPVAVLDSGVDGNHEDISSQVVKRANFSGSATKRNDVVAEDYYGHGTHVAGIVAATANNGLGVAGVCPNCTIMAGKVLSDSGMGTSSGLANGINWAATNGAKVINMSLVVGASQTLQTAVDNAWKADVVLVAAAGNSGSTGMMYPAAYPTVIAVGATDNNDNKASFSTHGSWVDVGAPGVSVYSTFPNHRFTIGRQNNRAMNYDIGSGTSMAAPIVAGVAGLAWSAHLNPSNTLVRSEVESSGEKKADLQRFWTNGRVNAALAVTAEVPVP